MGHIDGMKILNHTHTHLVQDIYVFFFNKKLKIRIQFSHYFAANNGSGDTF